MRTYSVSDIRQFFIDELNDGAFTKDRSGQKTIELIGASFLADEPAIFGEVNQDYVDNELRWYESESTNIYDIYDDPNKEPPQAWQYSANTHGEINSNYGFLIWNNRFHCQYERALEELEENPDSRRAIMIYNRPDIWMEYNNNGKNDFICTNAVTYYIRNDELQAVVQMRSNDVVFGYKNDFAWQQYVLDSLANDLGIQPGFITWQVQNLHVYERHFHLVK
tara:strand:- start:1448 stop:2113 length:666 start_codon:yes stop_codon:yes gene_type:complete